MNTFRALTVEPSVLWRRISYLNDRQVHYRFGWRGQPPVAELVLALPIAFIGWIRVEPAFRGRGLGVRIHELVAELHGPLTVERCCSPDEQRTIAGLVRRGWTVTDRTDIDYGGSPALLLSRPR